MFESLRASPSPQSPVPEGWAWTSRRLHLVPPAGFDTDPGTGPDLRLAELCTVAPSAQTLAELAAYDLAELDAGERVCLLVALERHAGWLAAWQQQAIVAVAGPAPLSRTADDWAEIDVAAALRLSPFSASRRVEAGRQLCGRLRATLRAVETGQISFWYALSLVEAVAPLDDPAAAQVEQVVLDGAATMTLSRFRERLRRAVIAAAPAAADEQHAAACTQRRIALNPQPAGMAWLSMFLTAPEAIAAYREIDARARAGAGLAPRLDPATGALLPPPGTQHDPVDALRADAFLAAVLGAPPPPGARPGAAAPRVLVTIDLPTLLRLADNPAQLDGYGPIPPELARRLAADGIWRRLIVDEVSGHLLDYGRSTYRPPTALVDYLRARDVTCRFPGCNRAAARCDLDHADPWDCDGSTCSPNMGALCRRHHRAKTHAGWRLESHPDGSATLTSARGHSYHRPAVNHAPEHTAHRKAARESDGELARDERPDSPAGDSARTATARDPDPDPDTSSGSDPPPF